jgi:hypothetical protein
MLRSNGMSQGHPASGKAATKDGNKELCYLRALFVAV